MKRKLLSLAILLAIQVSCAQPSTTTPTALEATRIASTSSEPAATNGSTPVEENEAPEIISLSLELGSLCANARTEIHFEAIDPDGNPLEIKFDAQFGTVVRDGSAFIYMAPAEMPMESFDTVSLEVSDGFSSASASTQVLLIRSEDTATWQQTSGPGGGFLTTIEIDINNPDLLYTAGGGGRIYKSIDAGETWQASAQFMEAGETIQQLFLNQEDSRTLYVIANQMYRSQDGGRTFTKILNVSHITYATMSAFDPDTLVVGTGDGQVLLTTDGGTTWASLGFPLPANSTVNALGASSETEFWVGTREWSDQADGQLFHTTNRGQSWDRVENFNQQPDSDIQTILIDPLNSDIVYVSLMQSYNEPFDPPYNRVVFKSTDGGETWEGLPLPEVWDTFIKLMGVTTYDRTLYIGIGGTWMYQAPDEGTSFRRFTLRGSNGDINDIAIDPRDPNVFYFPSQSAGILKTTDGGRTFEWKNTGISSTSVTLLETNAQAENGTIYATSANGEGAFRSFDYGVTWERITENGIAHPWADDIQINPHIPNQVWYVADVGQVQVSDTQGDRWTHSINTYGSGFRFGSIYALAPAPSNPNTLYALKNGFGIFRVWRREETSFLHHSEVDYSFAMAVHPEDEDIIVSGTIPKPFQSFALLQVSWNGGDDWETLKRFEGSTGITAVSFSPAEPNRLYVASGGSRPTLYRFDGLENAGSTLSAPWDTSETPDGAIHYIEVVPHPTLPDTVYVSAYPGGLFESDDAGMTWTRIDYGLPTHTVQDALRQGRYNLVVSSLNPERLYVGLYGLGVYASSDAGASWQATGPLPDGEILAMAVDPQNEELIYTGTSQGLYRSEDGGETWSALVQGMEGIAVRSLAWGSDGTLYAGTLGYEVYYLPRNATSWTQTPAFANFGTFWPIWNDRPLYQYTYLIFHPEDPDVIVLGTFPAGIFISRDGGETWQESNTNWSWDGVFALAFHPLDNNILYTGTYNGLNRSTDGGQTWEVWDSGWPDEQWTFSIDFDPRDPDVMYACSKNGENEGTGQPGFFMGSVMKSTDGGETWFSIMNGLPRDQEYYMIIVDPYTPDVVYLASQDGGVYISYDAGARWEQWNEGLTNISAGTNGNNVTNTMVLSPDGLYLYFASAGSGVFRRATVNAADLCGCNP